MTSFWTQLKKPFLVLAPMDDVTDVVFREVVAEVAPSDVFFTEFTNCDALFSPGRDVHMRRLRFTEQQRPIVGQIWGVEPENFYKTAKLLVELGFDGIDINMGCPAKDVIKTGTCSALIRNRSLAKEMIAATQEGAGNLPVSVKTRLGFDTIETEDWIGWLLEQDLAAITIHGRTVRELSKVPAHWDEIGKAAELRRAMKKETLIIGNGDVERYEQAIEYSKQYGVEGIMIGRGIFHDLWVFSPTKTADQFSIAERLKVLLKHVRLFHLTWGDSKNPDLLKKFLKVYVAGFPGANEMRKHLMEADSLQDLMQRIKEHITSESK